MATTAAQDGFRPVHEAHAIEQVLIAIQFAAPLVDDALRTVFEATNHLTDTLPGRHEIRGMGFQIGVNGVMPLASQIVGEMPSGVVRSSTDGSGVLVKELRIDRQSLVFRTQVYAGWAAVWAETSRYFDSVLQHVGTTQVASYGLTYIDKFIWQGRPETCSPGALLKLDSPYIAPKSFEARDLWHTHSGRFLRNSDFVKRLEAVDVDCLDEPDLRVGSTQNFQRVVRVATNVVDFYNQPGFAARVISGEEARQGMVSAFAELHAQQKVVISQILNAEAAQRIGLQGTV